MNERNEIGGDLRDEYLEIQERDECDRDAPERDPITDSEMDDWYQNWTLANVPDLVPDGEDVDGTPRYRFVSK